MSSVNYLVEALQRRQEQYEYGPRREKTCLPGFANNTGTDQPVHLCSLISAFVIRFLENIFLLDTSEISIL